MKSSTSKQTIDRTIESELQVNSKQKELIRGASSLRNDEIDQLAQISMAENHYLNVGNVIVKKRRPLTSKPGTGMKRRTQVPQVQTRPVEIFNQNPTTRGNLKASEYGRTIVKHVYSQKTAQHSQRGGFLTSKNNQFNQTQPANKLEIEGFANKNVLNNAQEMRHKKGKTPSSKDYRIGERSNRSKGFTNKLIVNADMMHVTTAQERRLARQNQGQFVISPTNTGPRYGNLGSVNPTKIMERLPSLSNCLKNEILPSDSKRIKSIMNTVCRRGGPKRQTQFQQMLTQEIQQRQKLQKPLNSTRGSIHSSPSPSKSQANLRTKTEENKKVSIKNMKPPNSLSNTRISQLDDPKTIRHHREILLQKFGRKITGQITTATRSSIVSDQTAKFASIGPRDSQHYITTPIGSGNLGSRKISKFEQEEKELMVSSVFQNQDVLKRNSLHSDAARPASDLATNSENKEGSVIIIKKNDLAVPSYYGMSGESNAEPIQGQNNSEKNLSAQDAIGGGRVSNDSKQILSEEFKEPTRKKIELHGQDQSPANPYTGSLADSGDRSAMVYYYEYIEPETGQRYLIQNVNKLDPTGQTPQHVDLFSQQENQRESGRNTAQGLLGYPDLELITQKKALQLQQYAMPKSCVKEKSKNQKSNSGSRLRKQVQKPYKSTLQKREKEQQNLTPLPAQNDIGHRPLLKKEYNMPKLTFYKYGDDASSGPDTLAVQSNAHIASKIGPLCSSRNKDQRSGTALNINNTDSTEGRQPQVVLQSSGEGLGDEEIGGQDMATQIYLRGSTSIGQSQDKRPGTQQELVKNSKEKVGETEKIRLLGSEIQEKRQGVDLLNGQNGLSIESVYAEEGFINEADLQTVVQSIYNAHEAEIQRLIGDNSATEHTNITNHSEQKYNNGQQTENNQGAQVQLTTIEPSISNNDRASIDTTQEKRHNSAQGRVYEPILLQYHSQPKEGELGKPAAMRHLQHLLVENHQKNGRNMQVSQTQNLIGRQSSSNKRSSSRKLSSVSGQRPNFDKLKRRRIQSAQPNRRNKPQTENLVVNGSKQRAIYVYAPDGRVSEFNYAKASQQLFTNDPKTNSETYTVDRAIVETISQKLKSLSPSPSDEMVGPLTRTQQDMLNSFNQNNKRTDMKQLGVELVRGIKAVKKEKEPKKVYQIGDITENLIKNKVRNSVPPPEATVQKQLKSGHVIMTQQVINGVQKVEIDKLPIPKHDQIENILEEEGSPMQMMPAMMRDSSRSSVTISIEELPSPGRSAGKNQTKTVLQISNDNVINEQEEFYFENTEFSPETTLIKTTEYMSIPVQDAADKEVQDIMSVVGGNLNSNSSKKLNTPPETVDLTNRAMQITSQLNYMQAPQTQNAKEDQILQSYRLPKSANCQDHGVYERASQNIVSVYALEDQAHKMGLVTKFSKDDFKDPQDPANFKSAMSFMQPKQAQKSPHRVTGLDLQLLQIPVENTIQAEQVATEYRGNSTLHTEEKSRLASNMKYSVNKLNSDNLSPHSQQEQFNTIQTRQNRTQIQTALKVHEKPINVGGETMTILVSDNLISERQQIKDLMHNIQVSSHRREGQKSDRTIQDVISRRKINLQKQKQYSDNRDVTEHTPRRDSGLKSNRISTKGDEQSAVAAIAEQELYLQHVLNQAKLLLKQSKVLKMDPHEVNKELLKLMQGKVHPSQLYLDGADKFLHLGRPSSNAQMHKFDLTLQSNPVTRTRLTIDSTMDYQPIIASDRAQTMMIEGTQMTAQVTDLRKQSSLSRPKSPCIKIPTNLPEMTYIYNEEAINHLKQQGRLSMEEIAILEGNFSTEKSEKKILVQQYDNNGLPLQNYCLQQKLILHDDDLTVKKHSTFGTFKSVNEQVVSYPTTIISPKTVKEKQSELSVRQVIGPPTNGQIDSIERETIKSTKNKESSKSISQQRYRQAGTPRATGSQKLKPYMVFDQESKKKGKTWNRIRDEKNSVNENANAVNRDLEIVKSRLMIKSNTSKDLESFRQTSKQATLFMDIEEQKFGQGLKTKENNQQILAEAQDTLDADQKSDERQPVNSQASIQAKPQRVSIKLKGLSDETPPPEITRLEDDERTKTEFGNPSNFNITSRERIPSEILSSRNSHTNRPRLQSARVLPQESSREFVQVRSNKSSLRQIHPVIEERSNECKYVGHSTRKFSLI